MTTSNPTAEDPADAADNTAVGETGSFPGEHGAQKAKQAVETGDLSEPDHDATGTPAPAEGAA